MSVLQHLQNSKLFNALNDTEFKATAEAAEELSLTSNETIVREGETGDALYLIVEGSVQVFTFASDGREVVLARIDAPGFFGEQALLPGASEKRNAYVRAFTDCKIIRVAKDSFQKALSKDNPLKDKLVKVGEEQVRENLVKQSLLFRSLQISDNDDWHETRSYDSGEVLFREGDIGDKFYVLLSGIVGVYKMADDGSEKLLVKLNSGQCFGELALIEKKVRAATIIAEGPIKVMSIDGAKFLELYEEVPEIRDYMQTLQKVYVLPGRGFTTQHAGQFMNMDAITTIYHLTGRKVVASRVIGREIYNMSLSEELGDSCETLRYEKSESGHRIEIVVDGTRVVGVTVEGIWDELGDVHQIILKDQPLHPWQRIVFQERGTLKLEDEANFYEDSDLICHCMEVDRGTLCAAIKAGCKNQQELTEQTGAGSVCGACIPRVKELLGNADWTPVRCSKKLKINSQTHSFRFETFDGSPLKAFEPGQHIVVSAQMDGNWIQRPYTLSSACTETSYHEITVKREPHGLFSNWLFDRMRSKALIRISSPQGEFKADLNNDDSPIVCIVGGIGMTPALSILRSIVALKTTHKLLIDYSCSTSDQFAYLHELKHAEFEHENISLVTRNTREVGRLTQDELAKYIQMYPKARIYICGPENFQQTAVEHLTHLKHDANRIFVEEFIPQGKKPEQLLNVKSSSVAGSMGHPYRPAVNPIPPGMRPGEGGPPQLPRGAHADDGASIEEQAREYLKKFYEDKGVPQAFESRWSNVKAELDETGTYLQTYDEMSYGAKLAWRNSARCIGRLFWQGLQVRDMRHLTEPREIFEEICEHIRLATNDGNLRAVMTVFQPPKPGGEKPRLWNPQLIRYAGYLQEDGSVVGDPAQLELTKAIQGIGWEGPEEQGHFDILPIVVDLPGRDPEWFEIPKDLILEVSISHPDYPWFEELGLRWYALPAVSEMLFDCGGVQYSMAPFNGWYMGTEIGARNFSDVNRYNQLGVIAEKMGLSTRRDRTLWKDRALVELNLAVLHSFELAGAKMTDHHAASNDFMEFIQQEAEAGRSPDVRWRWVVPPISASATDVFHVIWEEFGPVRPNYFYQDRPYLKYLAQSESTPGA